MKAYPARWPLAIVTTILLSASLRAVPPDQLPGPDMPPPPVDAAALRDFGELETAIPPEASSRDASLWNDEQRGELIAAMARSAVGVPYRTGSASPQNGFDCSGLSSFLYARFGIALPRSAAAQFESEALRTVPEPATGDLLFFRINHQVVSHVGVYIGDGLFIHAPRPGRTVEFADLNASYWQQRFAGARGARQATPDQNSPGESDSADDAAESDAS